MRNRDPEPSLPMPSVEGERYEADVPDTLDLAERAAYALNALTRLPDPQIGYISRQIMQYAARPAYMEWPILLLSPKYAEAMPMMRAMCGSDLNLGAEQGLMESLLARIRSDGLLYSPETDDWAGAYAFTNARTILAMMAWHQRDGDPAWLKRIEQLSQGIERIVIERDDYAYYPPECGYSAEKGWTFTKRPGTAYYRYTPPDEPTRDQQGIEGTVKGEQGSQIRCLARWYAQSGDKRALEVAGKLTRFVLKPDFWEPGYPPALVGPEHARYEGHVHGTGMALRGLLEYALVTRDKRLMQFVRDGYEYTRCFGISRIGWFPGMIDPEKHGRPRVLFGQRNEACGMAEMIALAIRLSDAGIGDYWEDVDQYVRNQFVEQQVIDADLMQKASDASPEHTLKPPEETDDDVIARTVGAFTVFADVTHAGTPAGCCTGNGTQALYYAWEGSVRHHDGRAQVNLLLNRASPWLDVDSYLPYEGKVVLRIKTAKRVDVRIPYWVDKGAVRCHIGRRESAPAWLGNYLLLEGLKPADVVTITFPVVESVETYHTGDTTYTCTLRGNTLVNISPREDGPTLYPIYLRQHMQANEAPMKRQERFVAPSVIRW
ncbi:MAG: glycoside hydrolase family protein [Anaerolineae bacterium]